MRGTQVAPKNTKINGAFLADIDWYRRRVSGHYHARLPVRVASDGMVGENRPGQRKCLESQGHYKIVRAENYREIPTLSNHTPPSRLLPVPFAKRSSLRCQFRPDLG